MVHRVTVGWCHGGCCGGRMYCPKAGYLEKIKAITSRLLGSRRERKIGICRISKSRFREIQECISLWF